jgi:FG-GAP repeat
MNTQCASLLRLVTNARRVTRAIVICLLIAPGLPAGAAGPLHGEEAIQHLQAAGQYDSLAAAVSAARHGTQPAQSPDASAATTTRSSAKESPMDSPFAQQAHLKASNAGRLDRFGWSVAISGDTAVVGAPFEDSSSTGVNGFQGDNFSTGTQSGAAYVFVRSGTTWTQQAYLKASNTGDSDTFGASVAVSGDSVVVGSPGEDSAATGINGNQGDQFGNGPDSGAAYVFVRNGTTWTQQAYLKASNTGLGDGFGGDVTISGDTVVVGALNEQSSATGINGNQSDNTLQLAGAAYVFVRSGTTWSQQAYLKPSNTRKLANFGRSVSVSGDTAVIGASGGYRDSPDKTGAAYVFARSGTTWSEQAYLKASNAEDYDLFGYTVAASGDTVVALGKQGVHVFVRSGMTWSPQALLKGVNPGTGDGFGTAVDLSGDTLVVGAVDDDGILANSGAAYIFLRSGTTWTQKDYLKAGNTGSLFEFGLQVAVSGETVLVGANREGISESPKNPSLVWTVGKEDNSWPVGNGGGPNTTFVQENGRSNPLPGNPANREVALQGDDDYYFAGTYTTVIAGNGSYVPVGVVAANEESAERGFSIADNNLRYHFNLPSTLIQSDSVSIIFNTKDLDLGKPDSRYGVEIYFNGVKVQGEILIRPDQLDLDVITEPFSLATVNAQTGPGFDNIVWLKGIKHNTQGGGNYLTLDYVKLHSWGRQTNDFGAAYIFGLSKPAAPEIAVEQPSGTDLPDGSSQNFGEVTVGSYSSLSFTIKNTGTVDLTGLELTMDGTDAAQFAVTTEATAPVAGPAGSTMFTVRFTPKSVGVKTAELHLASNDDDERSFDITLTGAGSLPASLPPIGTVTFTPAGLQLTMPVSVGQSVGVEYSETLSLGSWIDLGNVTVIDGTGSYTDTDAARLGKPHGFYRAVLR